MKSAAEPGTRFEPRVRRWSIAGWITVGYAISTIGLMSLAFALVDRSLVTMLASQVDRSLAEKITIVRKLLHEQPEDLAELRHEVEWEWSSNAYALVWLRVLDPSTNRIVAETPGIPKWATPEALPPPLSEKAHLSGAAHLDAPGGWRFRALSAEATLGRGPAAGSRWVVQAVMDFSRDAALMGGYRNTLAGVMALMACICIPMGWYLARRALASVATMSAGIAKMDSDTLHLRLSTEGLPVELETLGTAYNAALSRLQESFERLGRFSSDIAHELRTPLTNLRGAAEVALARERSPEVYREVIASSIEECERVTDIVDRLLFLARADHPESALALSLVDVPAKLEAIRAFYEAAADDAGVALAVKVEGPLELRADAMLLQRAISNLVANALGHTPRGGTVTLHGGTRPGCVWLTVSDTGCGVAAEHLPFVFDRLYRVDTARSSSTGGVGLGLAIVASVARLHRGRAWMESTVGEGTRVHLELPA